jgi:uncharacterized membrane protein
MSGSSRIAPIARVFVAMGVAEFGIFQLYSGHFARWAAKLPPWIPSHAIWPYVTGIIFAACAAAILFTKYARPAAQILSATFLAIAMLSNVFEVAANPRVADLWGRAGKVFALSGAAALVAKSIRDRGLLSSIAPYFVGIFFCISGIEHFIYAPFVKQMIPAWIPPHTFWTYFTATCLICGGLGVMMPQTRKLAGALAGIMVFSWVIMLHIPRALADLHHNDETSGVFEALAISGAAFLIAATSRK